MDASPLAGENMNARPPHFLLFSGACRSDRAGCDAPDRWRFVLESVHGDGTLEASDSEPGVAGERLELLSVVRGLEALDQPSRVTLVTPSRYITSGMRYGVREWRDSEWRWERFGHQVPVKNADLWQRVERALQFHNVDCKFWQFDVAQTEPVETTGKNAHRSRGKRRKRETTSVIPPSRSVWDSLTELMRGRGSRGPSVAGTA